jgi:hypothetical protein
VLFEEWCVPEKTRKSVLFPHPTAFAVALVLGLFAGIDVQAGVILPWQVDQGRSAPMAPDLDFMMHRRGAVATAMQVTESLPEVPRSERAPARSPHHELLPSPFDNMTGGASTPTSGSSGSPSSGSMVALPAFRMAREADCAFRDWRERSPRLPHHAPNELLDPPKLCA